jgi:predicted small lipoprotein YifL
MKNRFILIFIIILLCFTVAGCAAQPETRTAEGVKYTLYIGLNDKNTYTQLLSTEDAANKVADIA